VRCTSVLFVQPTTYKYLAALPLYQKNEVQGTIISVEKRTGFQPEVLSTETLVKKRFI
jgi:hypothetical protein